MVYRWIKQLVLVISLSCGMSVPLYAGSFTLPAATGIGGALSVPLQSITESKFDGVVKQFYDFSCGSAAIATLLTYHYEHSVDEQDVFTYMWERGDKKKIESLGFSMLDMKKYLEAKGYKADGFKISMERFRKFNVPGVALINSNGYQHFVVVKGMSNEYVLLGDPAFGRRIVTRDQFKKEWGGIIFLIRNHANVGRYYFNQRDDWGNLASAPLEAGVARNTSDLSEFSLSLPQPGDF